MRCLPVVCDAAEEQSVIAAFKKIKDELGPVDCLVYLFIIISYERIFTPVLF